MPNPQSPIPPNPRTQSALIVFAKPPAPGCVKTRLTELLTDEEAAALYEAFLRDALAQYARLDADVRLYVSGAPETLSPMFISDAMTIHRQRGDGLGARMAQAFEETFAAGFERVVIIGTDHPTLPAERLKEAFAALVEPEAMPIGPSDDGGYYLLGMRRLYPQIFQDMAYSHPRVFEETVAHIRGAGARPVVLRRWYDVDTPDDLKRLAADLANDGTAVPHTRRRVAALAEHYPSLA